MPVVGVVENMAGFTTEDGRHYPLFGAGGGQQLADELAVPLLGSVPLDPYVVAGGDDGLPVVRAHPDAPAAVELRNVASRLTHLLPPAEDETCTSRIALLAEQLEQMAGAPSAG